LTSLKLIIVAMAVNLHLFRFFICRFLLGL
jgi:hypothetical protein